MTEPKTGLYLTNSRTRRKEAFAPIDPENVRMYVCGPTVYDRAHLGNARPVVVFDVLYRLLRHVYGADHVTYVRNFTDVDDKINAAALVRKQAGDPRSLEALIAERTDETIGWYHADMDDVGALRPDHEPRATDYIPAMVEMIETLIQKGFAYTAPISYGHNSRVVYFKSEKAPEHSFFRVESDENYGELSGRGLDEMISGARAETGEGKRNPMDFVLWKPSTVDEPGWESPWGLGRPGWHIECSAMSKALLGTVFDIHGGGIDLQFPHHENEIAQSCCANDTEVMANVWLHNEMLLVEGKKMSKSLGNFFTVHDLLDQGVPGEVIRYVLLMTHYRSPMDWTRRKAHDAQIAINEMASMLGRMGQEKLDNLEVGKPFEWIVEALADDLNTHLSLSKLRKTSLAKRLDSHEFLERLDDLYASQLLLGFDLKHHSQAIEKARSIDENVGIVNVLGDPELSPVAATLNRLWAAAKVSKDFSEVDALKMSLNAAGVEVRMSKMGVELSRRADFDPAKLAALK